MKLLLLLTLLFALTLALDLDPRQDRGDRGGGGGKGKRARKRTSRPRKFNGEFRATAAARRPSGAPARYRTDIDRPTRKRSKSALTRLPAELIDADSPARRRRDVEERERRELWVEGMRVAAALKRQSTANDFYECQSSNPAPADADCQVIIDQVYDTNQTLILGASSCVTFGYESCKGFFCSLCSTMSTTTDFIGNQLSSAENLCVSNGQAGTIVGQDPPQWDAGFVYDTDTLPSYDVC